MKTFFHFLLFFAYFSLTSYPNIGDFECSTGSSGSSVYAATGGKYKPSANQSGQYFRVLFVFAQFQSDITVISNWPKNSLPNWASSLIDDSPSSSYTNHTISDYFKEMSNGDFDVIGDVFDQIITIDTNKSYTQANQYVLEQIENSIEDFTRYDNWKLENGVFVFSEGNGDGYLDMVHIVYRWADGSSENQWFNLNGGIAHLGISSDFVTHDNIKISGLSLDARGSGITTNNKGNYTDNFHFIQHFAHEFGHYLFGGNHTSEGGIMQGEPYGYDGITYAMNAWERERLGYTSFFNAYNGYTKTLRDYVTSGDAIKIQINSSEILVIENHQRISPYDQVMRGGALEGNWNPTSQLGKGLYIYYIQNANNYPCTSFILGADGGWDWQFAGYISMPEGWPAQLPLIDKGDTYRYLPNQVTNQIGKTDRNPRLKVNGLSGDQNYRWHSRDPVTNQWVLSRNVMGDETDAYNLSYNNILSPWSNPSTTKFSGGSEILTNISVLLSSQNQDGDFTVQIYNTYNSSLALPPSKPQNLQLTNIGGHPVLTWEANPEPDISSYRVYKKLTLGAGGTQTTYFTTTSTTYTDDKFTINHRGYDYAEYWVVAVDNTGLLSVESDHKNTTGSSFIQWKQAENNEPISKIDSYDLSQCYPNPFNPSTQIDYSIKEDGFVILKIYDILGNEVATLVNEPKQQGNYSINFDASHLPGGRQGLTSGVYIYTLKVNDFFASNKMILTK